jgi:kinesin family protein 4/21/27
LNTIKYATKAMNIKNKPIINRDPHSAQVNALKERIQQLEAEVKGLKKALSENGIAVPLEEMRSDPRTDVLSE